MLIFFFRSIKVSPSFLLVEPGSCQQERQRIKVEKQMLMFPTLLPTYWAQEVQSFQTRKEKPSPLPSPGLLLLLNPIPPSCRSFCHLAFQSHLVS